MIIPGVIASSYFAAVGDYESIASLTVGAGGSSTITFSSIPSTYQHLQIRIMAKSENTGNNGDYAQMRFNSDTGSNYTYHRLKGDGSSATAAGFATGALDSCVVLERITTSRFNFATETQGVIICDVLDYADVNKYTTTRSLGGYDNNGSGEILLMSSLWTNTAAISTITFTTPTANDFAQHTHFALYGIKG